MSRILGRAGRIEAPPDRSLDPRQATRAGGFLRAEGDRGRARATALPVARPGLGDFGPLLYYSMGDATNAGGGVVTVPNRTSLSADLTSSGTAPGIVPFVPGDARHGGVSALEFVEASDSMLSSPALSEILAANLSGSVEIVMLLCLTDPVADYHRIFGGLPESTGSSPGDVQLFVAPAQMYAARITDATASDVVLAPYPEVGVPCILHFVIRDLGGGTAEIDYSINGVASGARFAVDTGGHTWTGSGIYIGAAPAGLTAPPMRLRELAVYSRELTLAERLAMYSGAFAAHESIARRPRFEDVLDLSAAAYRSWHPERYPVVVAGVVKSIDGFENTAGTGSAQGTSDTGRGFVTLDGTTDYFDDTETPIAHLAADSFTLVVAFLSSLGGARRTHLSIGAHLIESTIAGEIRAFVHGVSLTAPVIGDATGKIGMAVLRVSNSLTMTLDAAAFTPGAATFTVYQNTSAFVPADLSLDLRIGASSTGSRLAIGSEICALAFAGDLTDTEVASVMRFIHQEYNN